MDDGRTYRTVGLIPTACDCVVGPVVAPVVILARLSRTGLFMERQIPALADAGYHVLAPDQRGYGGSTEAIGPTTFTG